jgi:hypothetical protein
MKIIDRYVASVVIAGTLTALLVVIGLDAFFSLIGQIDDVGEGDYTLLKMLATVALTIPHGMYELFPVAALLGSLTGMGRQRHVHLAHCLFRYAGRHHHAVCCRCHRRVCCAGGGTLRTGNSRLGKRFTSHLHG